MKLISYALYGGDMLKFCVVCVLITRLQGKSLEHKLMFIAWKREVSRNWQQTAQEGSRKMAGQRELFTTKMPSTTSPVAFVCIDTRPSEEPSDSIKRLGIRGVAFCQNEYN